MPCGLSPPGYVTGLVFSHSCRVAQPDCGTFVRTACHYARAKSRRPRRAVETLANRRALPRFQQNVNSQEKEKEVAGGAERATFAPILERIRAPNNAPSTPLAPRRRTSCQSTLQP